MGLRVSFHSWCSAAAILTLFTVTSYAGDFSTAASGLIGRELEAIRAEQRAPLEWKIEAAPLPVSRQDAPAELREAWNYFRAVYRPAHPAAAEKRSLSFLANEQGFYAVLDRIAGGENEGALDELAQYRWGSWCGTGSEMMTEPKTWARWLVLLRERRLAEAVTASLEVESRGVASRVDSGLLLKLRLQLFEVCGIDWEKLFAGMATYVHSDGRLIEGMPGTLFFQGGGGPAEILAAAGSERGANYILQLADLIGASERREYVKAVMLLRKPAGYHRKRGIFVSGGSTPSERSSPDSLPADLQRQVTRTLSGWLKDLDELYTLREIIGMLAEVHGPVKREALRGLLTHWSSQVANTAGEALRKMGEEPGPSQERGPVRFRILVNGQPLANRNVEYQVAMSDGSQLFGPGKTDEHGVASIERDYFCDPKRTITLLTYSARTSNSAPWFTLRVPVPAKLDFETLINIQAEPVTFVLPPNRAGDSARGKNAVVKLQRLDAKGGPSSDYSHGRGEWSLLIAPELVLPGVQPGEYDIELRVPGAVPWKASRQKLGTFATTLRVALESE